MIAQTKKKLLVAAGFLSLAIGFIGIFLPLLPTAPFILLAAFCFSKGSERQYRWLVTHPRMGPLVLDWEKHGVIRRKAKVAATVMILISSSTMIALVKLKPVFWAVIGFTFACVLAYIWTRPSLPRDQGVPDQGLSGRQNQEP